VSGLLGVIPGEILYIFVGGSGTDATQAIVTGGYNGGGSGQQYSGGGGGGATDIRIGGLSLTNRVAVAAGGGGANTVGGYGGEGGNSSNSTYNNILGQGSTGIGGGGGGGYYGGNGGLYGHAGGYGLGYNGSGGNNWADGSQLSFVISTPGNPASNSIKQNGIAYVTYDTNSYPSLLNTLTQTLATNSAFYSSLAANKNFVTALAQQITTSSNNYGISKQGPVGPMGLTGATGPQGPAGVFVPSSILTNTSFLSSLATNTTFISTLATNPAFVTALAKQITSPNTNYGIASKLNQTLNFPVIPAQTYSTFKTVTLNATSSAGLTNISYSIGNSALGIISNNVLLLQGTGTTTIKASQSGNPYYNPASASQSLIVK